MTVFALAIIGALTLLLVFFILGFLLGTAVGLKQVASTGSFKIKDVDYIVAPRNQAEYDEGRAGNEMVDDMRAALRSGQLDADIGRVVVRNQARSRVKGHEINGH